MGEVVDFPRKHVEPPRPGRIFIAQQSDGGWVIHVEHGARRDVALPIAFETADEAEVMARNYAQDAGVHFPPNGELTIWNEKRVDRSEAWVVDHYTKHRDSAAIIVSGLPSYKAAIYRALYESYRLDALFACPFIDDMPGAA